MKNHLLVFGDLNDAALAKVASQLPSGLPGERFDLPLGAYTIIFSGLMWRISFGDLQGASEEQIARCFEIEQNVPISNAAVVVVENGMHGSGFGADEVLIGRFPGAQIIFVANNSGMAKRIK